MPTLTQDEKSVAENKRYTPRWGVQTHFTCRMNEEDTVYEGHLKDMSCSGACITTDQCFAINQKINLTLFLSEKGIVRLCGTAVWTKVVNFQKRVGIHFFNTNSETQETIFQHVLNVNKEFVTDYWFKGWERR